MLRSNKRSEGGRVLELWRLLSMAICCSCTWLSQKELKAQVKNTGDEQLFQLAGRILVLRSKYPLVDLLWLMGCLRGL